MYSILSLVIMLPRFISVVACVTSSFSFYGQVIFHGMDRSHFVYLFISWWIFGLLPPFASKNKYSPLSYSFLDIREGLTQEALRREDPGRSEYNPGWWEQGDPAVGSVSQVLSYEREPRGQSQEVARCIQGRWTWGGRAGVWVEGPAWRWREPWQARDGAMHSFLWVRNILTFSWRFLAGLSLHSGFKTIRWCKSDQNQNPRVPGLVTR